MDKLPPNKPTLRDLAKHVGLALSTVSMALKDSPNIARSTCARVKQGASEIGYVPDPRISNVMGYLKRKRTEKPAAALAYISNYSSEIELKNHPVYHNYFLGAQERALKLGYNLQDFNLKKEGLSEERITTILESRGIEGIIIPPLFKGVKNLDIDLSRFASVTFGFSFHNKLIRRVTLDHFDGAMKILEAVGKLGYRRIGFILGPHGDSRMQYRWSSALYSFIARNEEQERIDPLDTEMMRENILNWYDANKPDVVISNRLEWAQCLSEEGICCGRDYGFAHLEHESIGAHCDNLDDQELAATFRNGAGLDQQSRYIGSHAVELLAGDLSVNQKGLSKHPSITLIEGKWVEGSTLPQKSELGTPVMSSVG